jgi:nucleoside-diphosphate-sugar epimerase
MKVLVTGASGFVGRNLVKNITDVELYPITRKDLDLVDDIAVGEFFKDKKFDVIIHAAIVGGRRGQVDTPKVLSDNVVSFYNLMNNSKHFKKFINIGSGAELDRRYNINPNTKLYNRFPIDYYGLSKNIIAKNLAENVRNFSNLRSFGIFGKDESTDRFIRSSVLRAINGEDIIIHQNRVMDFFYIDDLVELIKYELSNGISYGTINCSYEKHHTLVEIAEKILNITNSSSKIIVKNSNIGLDYYGRECRRDEVVEKFIGLEEGIRRIYLNEKNKLYNQHIG